ncbi:hypothetical protein ITZ95_000088 [Escherichia coli]|nr:hypothetical protein [Escherichia coli]
MLRYQYRKLQHRKILKQKLWRTLCSRCHRLLKRKRISPLWLSASSSACHGVLIITVITPSPTKNSATKMPEN